MIFSMTILNETAGSFPSLLYCTANVANLCLVGGMVDPCVRALGQQIPSIAVCQAPETGGVTTRETNQVPKIVPDSDEGCKGC